MLPTTTPITGTYYRYYFLGHGAQFRVYAVFTLNDKPTGRVIKVPLDFDESKRAIWEPLSLITTHSSEDELDELADIRACEIMQFKHAMPSLVQGILGRDSSFVNALGNLKILQTPIPSSTDDTSPQSYKLPIFFTQDYVMTLDSYLQRFRLAANKYTRDLDAHSIRILKDVIGQLIDLHYLIWQYGIFEFVFKPENFGIRFHNGSPKLIWMDLAEHITDLSQAEIILKETRWLHPLMPTKIDYQFMPTILHDYYAETCNKAFTTQELRKNWRKKCIRTEQQHAQRLRLKEITTRDRKKSVNYWVARHNLSTSLYHGFSERSIDDLAIPATDLSLLLADKNRENPADTTFIEEKIERALAAAGSVASLLYPLTDTPIKGAN
jgi:hypothetical protein